MLHLSLMMVILGQQNTMIAMQNQRHDQTLRKTVLAMMPSCRL